MLGPQDIARILGVLSSADGVLIVGGQALNLWAERYRSKAAELEALAPFTSKDLDYFGHRAAAYKLAAAIGGKIKTPTLGDATSSTAIVTANVDGHEVLIDFIGHVIGLKAKDLETAVEMVLPARVDGQATTFTLPVMHPVAVLKSRVANVMTPGLQRTDDVALRQMRAAFIVAREYLREQLDAGDLKEVTACYRSVFEWARSDIHGREVDRVHGLDPMELIVPDARLDGRYCGITLVNMHREIARRRQSRRE